MNNESIELGIISAEKIAKNALFLCCEKKQKIYEETENLKYKTSAQWFQGVRHSEISQRTIYKHM